MQFDQRTQLRFGFNGGFNTPAIRYIILINGIFYFLQMIVGDNLTSWFGLQPTVIFHHYYVWQFLTYMFLHAGFLHILLNMVILWMFGCEVERLWGSKEFLKFYFICGVGAGLFHLIFNATSPIPVVGASGAIYGILIAFALLFPDRPIILFPLLIPLKAKYWAIIFVALELILGFLGGQDHVAHFAHLGGMVIGFLYLRLNKKISIFSFEYFYRKKTEFNIKRMVKKRERLSQLRKEVDLILDRINEIGYDNLTEREKQVLKNASHSLSDDKHTPNQ